MIVNDTNTAIARNAATWFSWRTSMKGASPTHRVIGARVAHLTLKHPLGRLRNDLPQHVREYPAVLEILDLDRRVCP